MRINRISLSGFRNYDEESVQFGPDVNVIAGPNAQGKTNLLEAVYILTGNHSFRSRYDRELIGFDCDWYELLADIESGGHVQTMRIVHRKGSRKQITVNSAKKSASEITGLVTTVLFSPDDLYIIKDGPAVRRKMMDSAISQLRLGYRSLLSDYNRLYENKMHILKDRFEKPELLKTLDDFSDALAKCSSRIIRYRASYVKRLAELAAPIHREFSGGKEELMLVYKTVSTVTDPGAAAEEIYYQVCEHQEKHRQAELETCQCLTGAHKDDLEIYINGNPAKAYGSQGQMRTAAISIKLAEREIFRRETGEYPVLLLDDVLSELDESRQEFVLNRIGGGQTLITCCEGESIRARTGGRVFSVKNGKIRQEN